MSVSIVMGTVAWAGMQLVNFDVDKFENDGGKVVTREDGTTRFLSRRVMQEQDNPSECKYAEGYPVPPRDTTRGYFVGAAGCLAVLYVVGGRVTLTRALFSSILPTTLAYEQLSYHMWTHENDEAPPAKAAKAWFPA